MLWFRNWKEIDASAKLFSLSMEFVENEWKIEDYCKSFNWIMCSIINWLQCVYCIYELAFDMQFWISVTWSMHKMHKIRIWNCVSLLQNCGTVKMFMRRTSNSSLCSSFRLNRAFSVTSLNIGKHKHIKVFESQSRIARFPFGPHCN